MGAHCRRTADDVPFGMRTGHRLWIDLLNAQEHWITDASMLTVIPEDACEFDSAPEWPQSKALAYLHNNAAALRLNFQKLEVGEMLDVDLINPVLTSVDLRFVDWRHRPDWRELAEERRRRADRLVFLGPAPATEGWNRATSSIRHLVQRAMYHFCRYADQRLSDPAYPGATEGMFRVLPCPATQCKSVVGCPTGRPVHCSDRCMEDTGRLED